MVPFLAELKLSSMRLKEEITKEDALLKPFPSDFKLKKSKQSMLMNQSKENQWKCEKDPTISSYKWHQVQVLN